MNKEEIQKKIEELETQKWNLSISTDFFNESERKRYGQLCDEIAKLERMLKQEE